MSLVVGFVTGLTTGEAVERKKGRDRFRDYLERRGYSIIDREGHPVPVDVALSEALAVPGNSNRTIIIAGAVVATAAIITGGTALVLLSVI